MKIKKCIVLVLAATLALFLGVGCRQETRAEEAAAAREVAGSRIDIEPTEAYRILASGVLQGASLTDLPEGVVLRAGELTVTGEDIQAELAEAPAALQDGLRKHAFFVLQQIVTNELLARKARQAAEARGADPEAMSEQEMLQSYFEDITADVEVTDAEVRVFYEENRDALGGRPLDQVRDTVVKYLQQQNQQEAVENHMQSLAEDLQMEVSNAWVAEKVPTAIDNPVDRARLSGRPSLVDFGAEGCGPCDMLAPILEEMEEDYEGRADIVFVSVREEQILASRYGIRSIPVQVFFDAEGKEVFRHSGFWPREQLDKKLAEMGVE